MKILVCLCFALSFMDLCLCEDPVNITAEPGQRVTLPCRADRNGKVSAVMLTRDDLEPRYVLVYRDEQVDVNHQNPQYLGRTELQSLYSTDGEVNLTLHNVTEKDSGVYECLVKTGIRSNTRRKRAALERTTIHLHVAPAAPPGNKDGNRGEGGNKDGFSLGHVGLMVAGPAVVSLIVAMAIITVIRRKKINSPSPPDDAETPTDQLI